MLGATVNAGRVAGAHTPTGAGRAVGGPDPGPVL